MDFDFAVEWVKLHKDSILKFARKYVNFSPYEVEDFISAANEASLMAALQSTDEVQYRKQFWLSFRAVLRSIVPNPQSEEWSSSVPSHLCSADIPDNIPHPSTQCLDYTTESILLSVREYLPDTDRNLLYLVLGLSPEGKLSCREVGDKLGCSKQNVSKLFKRCLRDIRKLVESGKVSKDVYLELDHPGKHFEIVFEELYPPIRK